MRMMEVVNNSFAIVYERFNVKTEGNTDDEDYSEDYG